MYISLVTVYLYDILLYKGTVFDETLYANILWSVFIDKNAYTYFFTFRTLCFEAEFYCPCSNVYFHFILLYMSLYKCIPRSYTLIHCIAYRYRFGADFVYIFALEKPSFKGSCINIYF